MKPDRCEKTGKHMYKKRKSALNHIKQMKKRGVIISADANAYKCEGCGRWHLGHKRYFKDNNYEN
jgi:hypothetical protein